MCITLSDCVILTLSLPVLQDNLYFGPKHHLHFAAEPKEQTENHEMNVNVNTCRAVNDVTLVPYWPPAETVPTSAVHTVTRSQENNSNVMT
jgi:hypothetical protein